MASILDINLEPSSHPTGIREYLFIFVLCCTQLFMQGALGYILIPLPHVAKTFKQTGHEHMAESTWHIAAYSLTIASFILIAGRLGDMYGAKRVLLFGWTWFGAWSIICGCSAFTGNKVFFDVSRAIQGIGPAMLLPNALAIAGRTYGVGKRKNVVFSLIASSAPMGCAVSSLIAAALAEHVWWPWTLWLSGILCFILGAMAYVVVPKDKVIIEGLRFDWAGAVTGVGGLVLLNFTWNQAPVAGWSTPYVYVLLIVGFLLLGTFAWIERRTPQPILNLSILNRRVIGVLVVTALGWSSFGIWFYYLFQFMQQFRGVSAMSSALQFGPGALSGMLAPVFTVWALPRIPTAYLMVIASLAFLAGSLLEAFAPVHQSYWFNVFWSFVIMPWGMDISFPVSTLFISDAVPHEHQGISASLVNTVINYSIAIGLGIAGTVESQVAKGDLLRGYRAAQYTSVALAAMCVVVSIMIAAMSDRKVADAESVVAPPDVEKAQVADPY